MSILVLEIPRNANFRPIPSSASRMNRWSSSHTYCISYPHVYYNFAAVRRTDQYNKRGRIQKFGSSKRDMVSECQKRKISIRSTLLKTLTILKEGNRAQMKQFLDQFCRRH